MARQHMAARTGAAAGEPGAAMAAAPAERVALT